MKTRNQTVLICVGLFVAVLGTMFLVTYFDSLNEEEKYVYKFWIENVKSENNTMKNTALFSYSHDYGQGNTFSKPIDVAIDKEESTGGSMMVFNGQPYLVWHQDYHDSNTMVIATSKNKGVTLEKKILWPGAHPRIANHNDQIYIAWMEDRNIYLVTTDEKLETFSEPIGIFEPDWEFSPYAQKEPPHFHTRDNGDFTIQWESSTEDPNIGAMYYEYELYIEKDRDYNLRALFNDDDNTVEYSVLDAKTNSVEIYLPTYFIDTVWMVYVNGEKVDDNRITVNENYLTVKYKDPIETVKLFGATDLYEDLNQYERLIIPKSSSLVNQQQLPPIVMRIGETVVIENKDETAHNIVINGLDVTIPTLLPNDNYNIVMNKTGIFDYSIKPWLTGQITVEDRK